ncbi:uncharacterized protein BO72DRAFT_489263 [Aspergillus fijiensis CBS 313.89]|uniref:Uncharacterized protein n=1 Tax=Aspergillus fijiensis CBS 313.89 TaxID=1448319 RepID=A0A8G1VVD6_9EURO|nr:uncharacterized protein BO72DRAFT_489263 [Aspergillus fijiensis CBS 313.89]RAK73113.1 hypothetical protein BO72DRAFT_489263 [Aspergillus fijiensis CBS 313.89]
MVKWPKSVVSHFSSSKDHRAKQGVKGESKPDCDNLMMTTRPCDSGTCFGDIVLASNISLFLTNSPLAPAKATPAGRLVQIQPMSGLTWSMIRRWFRDPSQESLAASSRNPASTLRTATLDHSGIFTIFGNDNMYTISFDRRIAESQNRRTLVASWFKASFDRKKGE